MHFTSFLPATDDFDKMLAAKFQSKLAQTGPNIGDGTLYVLHKQTNLNLFKKKQQVTQTNLESQPLFTAAVSL
jgi:hypothetical protein